MKINKALRALILCLASTLAISGCAAAPDTKTPDKSVLPDSLSNLSFSGHMDISVGYWNIDNMVKAVKPDGMTQYIEDLFNVTLHPVSVTWANYKDRYQILSATDSLPDVFATLTLSSNDSNDSAAFADMIATGSIRALPENMDAYPILRQLLDTVSYTKYSDGSYYAIPRISFTESSLGAADAAMLVRKDWMEQLGLDAPESFEEFSDLVTAFALEDPDRNGINDTIGYNVNTLPALGKWVMLGIAPHCNVYSWIEQDNYYVPSWTTEEFKKVVAAYRSLYKSGGLDPEFYCKSDTTSIEDFAAGRLGALEYKSSPAALLELKSKWDVLNDKPFGKCVDVLPIFPAGDGVRYSNSSSIFWSESYLSSKVDDAKAERILAIYEFLLSPNGQDFCHYGIKGIDYDKTEAGTYQCLLDVEEASLTAVLTAKYPSFPLFSGIASWSGGSSLDFEESEMNYLRYGKDCIDLAHKSAVWYKENTTQLERPYEFLFCPKEASDTFGTSQAFDTFVECILGTEDPVVMWEEWLNDMYDQGLEEYILRQNENFQKHRQK